jgi:hypothetical protein
MCYSLRPYFQSLKSVASCDNVYYYSQLERYLIEAISVTRATACGMSAPPQANREWLGNRNACQKALWTVVVYQQMNDYADFVMKVRAEQTEFYGALDEALDLDAATMHIPNSDASRVATTLLRQMRVWADQRYKDLESMWDNTQRYTELMYRLFEELIDWPPENINDLGNDLAEDLELIRGNPDEGDADDDQWIREYIAHEREQRTFSSRPSS